MTIQTDFIEHFNAIQSSVHRIAKDSGWWDERRNRGELIALMHSELSEALEALRNGNPPDEHIPTMGNLEVELADTVIRIMDFAEANNLNIAKAIIEKSNFNMTRPKKHGKQF